MSDERREVARRLREYPVHLALGMEGGSPLRALAMLSGLLSATGLRQDEPARLYGRLADLIDPTCEANSLTDGEYYCSECGGNLGIEIEDESLLPSYCPECGARVTGDEDEG